VIQGSYGDIRVTQISEYVALVELNRPPDNYFDVVLVGELATVLETIASEEQFRAVVLGSIGRHFCAGSKLSGKPAPGAENQVHIYDMAIRVFAAKIPIIAAVEGAAIGGGLGLALAADFRVGAAEARFSANFAKLGFHHGFGLTTTLPRLVGQQRAAEILMTGKRLGGELAYEIGLLDRLVPLNAVRAEALSLATEIATSAPLAVRSIRNALRAELVEQVASSLKAEWSAQQALMDTEDYREGVRAMRERRIPMFTGR
jgi:2-(1,2-epoxy-1,2-dihydrophenyl)acetyl-CoA isomerase